MKLKLNCIQSLQYVGKDIVDKPLFLGNRVKILKSGHILKLSKGESLIN